MFGVMPRLGYSRVQPNALSFLPGTFGAAVRSAAPPSGLDPGQNVGIEVGHALRAKLDEDGAVPAMTHLLHRQGGEAKQLAGLDSA